MISAFVKELGFTGAKVAGATQAHTFTGSVAAGNLIVARIIFDNAATASKPIVSSISKMAGETNNWLFLGAARSTSTSAGAFASGEMWCIRTTVAWSAAAYTVTLDTSVTQKTVQFTEFSGVQAALRSTVGTAYSTTTTPASATTTGTTPQTGDLVVSLTFSSNMAAGALNDSDTTGGSWGSSPFFGTTGGNVATNNWANGQHKILTSGVHQTLNSSGAPNAGNGAIVAILQAIVDPAITQAAYQFFDDAGTESGAAALAAVNTPVTGNLAAGDGYGVLRVRLQSTNVGVLPSTDDWQLQYEKNGNGNWQNVVPDPGTYVEVLSDSYPETEALSELQIGNFVGGYPHKMGQSFVGNGHKLNRVGYWAARLGSGAGNLSCEIHAATSSSNATPLDPVLATSTVVSILTIGTTKTWVYFQFNGSFTLQEGVPYVALAYIDSVSTNTYLTLAIDSAAPTHPGSVGFWYTGFNTWDYWAQYDLAFRLYSTPNSSVYVTVPYNNPNLTDAAATTNRLGAGTGSFVAGKVSETGVVTDFSWTANNYTELVYSLKLLAANLAASDTLRFRVLRNGETTGMTYTQTPTINIIVGPGPVALAGSTSGTSTASATTVVERALVAASAVGTSTASASTLTVVGAGGLIKVWSGSAWVEKPVKVWTGSAWVAKPVKVWTGSAWVLS